MMLIVLDKDPVEAVNKLVTTTSKNFYFKQLIELGQLICSAGISLEYKRMRSGKEIQDWIKRNLLWVYVYFNQLQRACSNTIKMTGHTKESLHNISSSLSTLLHDNDSFIEDTTTAIFRYNKDYRTTVPTNTELPIDIAAEMYYNYLQWKFERK